LQGPPSCQARPAFAWGAADPPASPAREQWRAGGGRAERGGQGTSGQARLP
jgi:hypothetical protein